MAEEQRPIFNQKATDKLRNPDDLERYIQVTNPSVWVVLAACVALVLGLLAWGVFGSVTTSVSATGTVVNGNALCFLSADDVAKVDVDDPTSFAGKNMRVESVADVPLSREEARELLGSDYLAATLVTGDWGYKVTFDGDTTDIAQGVPEVVGITVERVSPISLILKNWG